MSTFTAHWDNALPSEVQGGVVAIGNFDGVHRGHIALLMELRNQADALGVPAVAVTFDPHPLRLLRPEKFQPELTTMADRVVLLHKHGADHVVVLQTTRDFLDLSARQFFDEVIRGRLAASAMVEGPNFGFGRNREGDVALLQAFGHPFGMALTIVPSLTLNGVIVSSSRVRGALNQGDIHEATNLLSRPYRLHGIVGTGQRRGRTLGFPTANLERIPTLIPADGVYAVRVHIDHSVWPGAMNIGPNPTFGEQQRKVEVHLIGFQGDDLLGLELALDLVERLRDTRKFASVSELSEQLRADVERARRIAAAT